MAGGAKLACYPALGIVEEAQGAPGGNGRSSRTTCQHHCNHGSVQDEALGLYAFNDERLDRVDDGRKTRDVQPSQMHSRFEAHGCPENWWVEAVS